MASQQADDLDDGLDYEVASSPAESATAEVTSEPEGHGEQAAEVDPEAEAAARRQKRRLKQKERKRRRMRELGMEGDAAAVGTEVFAPSQMADMVLRKIQQHRKGVSSVELDDLAIPESTFVDLAARQWAGKARSLDTLAAFIKEVCPVDVNDVSATRPPMVVVSPAALRVADVARALRALRVHGACEVAKLFSKHFKLSEHVEYMQRTRVGYAVGTPARLYAIAEQEALKGDDAQYILIDSSFTDAKKRTIWTIPEVCGDLVNLLTHPSFLPRLRAGETKIVMY